LQTDCPRQRGLVAWAGLRVTPGLRRVGSHKARF
jgi:hypothetical protein